MRNKPHSNKFKRLRIIAKVFNVLNVILIYGKIEKGIGSNFKFNYKRLKKMYNEKSGQSNAAKM